MKGIILIIAGLLFISGSALAKSAKGTGTSHSGDTPQPSPSGAPTCQETTEFINAMLVTKVVQQYYKKHVDYGRCKIESIPGDSITTSNRLSYSYQRTCPKGGGQDRAGEYPLIERYKYQVSISDIVGMSVVNDDGYTYALIQTQPEGVYLYLEYNDSRYDSVLSINHHYNSSSVSIPFDYGSNSPSRLIKALWHLKNSCAKKDPF